MSPNPTTCARCSAVSHQFLHTVPHRGTFHRLCPTCVLILHSHAFCPICLTLHTHIPSHTTTPSCFKCSSMPHSHCVDPTLKTPFICPICINPKPPVFQDFSPIDLNAARILLCAAKIVSGLMSKAVVEARVKAEKKAKTAIISRKKAWIATRVFDCVVSEAKIKEKLLDYDDSKCKQCGKGEIGDELLLCDKCDRGFHLFCIMSVLGSVPKGSWFCADCSALVQNKPDILMLNQTDLPDMAVDEKLLTEAMLRNITPPLSERARAWQSDKAETFKNKEKKQSTTERVSMSKMVGEVQFGATVPEEEGMTGNEEDLDGVNIGGDRSDIPMNGGDKEKEGAVDPDDLKKKKGKRPVSPSKKKVGGGHRQSSSRGKKRSNKESTIGESLVAGSVKCAKNCEVRCKKAEAELKGCEVQFDIMENQIKVAKKKVKDAKQQVHTAKKDAQIFGKHMKYSEDAAKKNEAELRTQNKEQEQELTALKKEVERLTAELGKQKDIADSASGKLDLVLSNTQVIKKDKPSPNYRHAVAIQVASGMNKFAAFV